ncbi:MAG: alcohol dehydrogenase catalytic domain-containing protein [Actinobacteria bacterium]|nr:alcohol dehydrogenase catalytic domain-containing protein [Actinomycetota bacterium]
MRAAVYHATRDIRVQDVDDPVAGPGEVLMEVRAAGICGTDAAEYAHGPRMYPIEAPHPVTGHAGPMIPGHEFAGVVIGLGPDVDGLEPGQLVVTGAGISCGRCPRCLAGRTNLCDRYSTLGLQRHGGLAQLCAVPADTCVPAPVGLTPDAAALGQPMAIAVHSMRQGRPEAGERALVIGAGGIGAFLTHALADVGARVSAVDRDPSRLSIAAALGAQHTLDPGPGGIAASVRDAGFVPEVVYEVTGTPDGLAAAFELVAPGGRVVAVGLQDAAREIDVRGLTLRELSLVGTNAHVCAADLPEALRLLAARPDPWTDVAPVALPLDLLVAEGIVPLVEGRSERIKTLIDPWADAPRPTRMAEEVTVADGA